jgi:type I restriction enzyme S subunit
MSDWPNKHLSEVADILAGFAFKSKDFTTDKGEFVIKIKNIIPPNIIIDSASRVSLDSYKPDRIGRFKLKKGDYVVAMTGATIGKVGVLKDDVCAYLNQRVAKICGKEIIDSRYIYYAISGEAFHIFIQNNIDSHSAQENISSASIGRFAVSWPDSKKRLAIAEVLSSIDDKLDLLNRQNETLEAMAQTLFRQWFIEEADDSWEEVSLPELFDFKEGPGIRNWQYVDNGYPFINIRLIKNKELDVSSANCVSHEEANGKYDHFKLAVDDFVMSTSGTLGKVAIVRSYHLPLMLNTSVIRFRPKKTYLKSFMYQYLQSSSFNEYLINAASGSVQLNFGPKHLKVLNVQCPPRELLEQFERQCGLVYKKINSNYYSIRNLSDLRDTLLPKLMSGEVRVKLD